MRGSNQDKTMTAKATISAVHDDDLFGFLNGLGVLNDVKNGNATCKFCDQTVSLENLVAVFPEGGDIKFVCDRQGCMAYLGEHRSELRGKERPVGYEFGSPPVQA
jgi:hypothetical protein